MIFVTLGNDKHPFNRLLGRIEQISKEDSEFKFKIQSGHTSMEEAKNISVKKFFDKEAFYKNIKNSQVTITHAGAGTLIKLIQANKKPIVVPRLLKYKEHLNDHQLEIANEFYAKDLCYIVNDIYKLDLNLIKRSMNESCNKMIKHNDKLFENIKNDFDRFIKL